MEQVGRRWPSPACFTWWPCRAVPARRGPWRRVVRGAGGGAGVARPREPRPRSRHLRISRADAGRGTSASAIPGARTAPKDKSACRENPIPPVRARSGLRDVSLWVRTRRVWTRPANRSCSGQTMPAWTHAMVSRFAREGPEFNKKARHVSHFVRARLTRQTAAFFIHCRLVSFHPDLARSWPARFHVPPILPWSLLTRCVDKISCTAARSSRHLPIKRVG